MKIIEVRKFDTENHDRATFIRVDPDNLNETLSDIFYTLSDLSWINKFDEEYIRNSFNVRAQKTINDIQTKLLTSSDDSLTGSAGEYLVSELSREAIISELNYSDIPLSELYNKKKTGNPGFDFHSQNDCEVVIFGEAKYLHDDNAYGTGLKQVVRFIAENKDINDILELRDFCGPGALKNANDGIKGFAVGFSVKDASSDNLITGITRNKNYQSLLCYHEIVLVAVNI